MNYQDFLRKKQIPIQAAGFDIDIKQLNPHLFEWQAKIVRWALKKGRCALFEECGLGKTIQQLSWADAICQNEGGCVLILAPLAVSEQTKREGAHFGINVTICESAADVRAGINITNYEKLEKFDTSVFIGVVLDESSILKNSTGKVKKQIIEAFRHTKYKLACSATPAPNDYAELGSHTEFLGIMSQAEMLATYFTHDGGNTSKWRLKGHAQDKFWEWIAEWAFVLDNPAAFGIEAKEYELPPLNVIEKVAESDNCIKDNQMMFFAPEVQTLAERREARNASLDDRVQIACDIVNNSKEQWLIWCDLNIESEKLKKGIPDAVEVKGADNPNHKTNSMIGFSDERIRVLISKPSICGFGMNWQNCHNMIFVGLSDSFEKYYQAIRRCYRFGQAQAVNVYIIISEGEMNIKGNIVKKQTGASNFTAKTTKFSIAKLESETESTVRMTEDYKTNRKVEVPQWIV